MDDDELVESCTICTEVLGLSSRPACQLPCGHVFCAACVSQWRENKHQDCPQCRQPFEKGRSRRLWPWRDGLRLIDQTTSEQAAMQALDAARLDRQAMQDRAAAAERSIKALKQECAFMLKAEAARAQQQQQEEPQQAPQQEPPQQEQQVQQEPPEEERQVPDLEQEEQRQEAQAGAAGAALDDGAALAVEPPPPPPPPTTTLPPMLPPPAAITEEQQQRAAANKAAALQRKRQREQAVEAELAGTSG